MKRKWNSEITDLDKIKEVNNIFEHVEEIQINNILNRYPDKVVVIKNKRVYKYIKKCIYMV